MSKQQFFDNILAENLKLIVKYRAQIKEQEQRLKQYDIMYEIKCLELNEYIIKYNRNRVILELEHIKNIN